MLNSDKIYQELAFIGKKMFAVICAISRAIGHANWIDKRKPTILFTMVAPVSLLTSASLPLLVLVADVDWWFDKGGDCAMFGGRTFTVSRVPM